MLSVDTVILATGALLAILLIAAGLFGRPNDARPVCVRCRRDARPLAWSDLPRCPCGADLTKAGAVRTSGRVRRPRLAITGIVLFVVVTVATVVAVDLGRKHLTWIDLAPLALIEPSAIAGNDWAVRSVQRRANSTAVAADEALRLLHLVRQPTIAATFPNSGWEGSFASAVSRCVSGWREGPLQQGSDAIEVAGVTAIEDPGATDRGTHRVVHLAASPVDAQRSWMVRIDRVRIDGHEVRWELTTVGRRDRSPVPVSRAFLHDGTLTVESEGRAEGTIEIDVRLIDDPAVTALQQATCVHDELGTFERLVLRPSIPASLRVTSPFASAPGGRP